MRIDSGLFDHGVLQRTAEDVSDAAVAGACTANGAVLARVTRDGAVVSGFDGVIVGAAADGAFTARLAGLPVGGPYAVELAIAGSDERLRVDDVLVGDLWILGGQSNMQGCGITADGEPPHPLVRAWYMDDRWDVARDPLHNLWAAVDRVHTDIMGGVRPAENLVRSAGPGVAFGVEMQRLTGVPQGVIACAHGGTSMAQWDPKLKRRGGRSLYGATLRRVRKLGGRVAGLVWYQGCSDTNADCAAIYTPAMQALMRAFRRDLNAPDLPVVIVQIAGVFGIVGWGDHWNAVQEQQRLLPKTIKRLAVVPAIDLSLDDLIHISGADQNRLGRRLAAAMRGLATGAGAPAIAPKSSQVVLDPRRGTADVVVTFDHVAGSLQAPGRPWGFSLTGDGPEDVIYRVDLDGNKAILRTSLGLSDINERQLWYGRGLAPYCNITDSADRPIPVFGPLRLGVPRALTPFVRALRVSPVLALDGGIGALACPSAAQWPARAFAGTLCDVHLDAGRAQTPQMTGFACRLQCPESMRLDLLLGYDGPVKAWVDGNAVFCDPHGTNPAVPDGQRVPLTLAAGEHEVLIVLDLNQNRAWGLYLRFERADVSKRLLAKGPGAYAMPTVLG